MNTTALMTLIIVVGLVVLIVILAWIYRRSTPKPAAEPEPPRHVIDPALPEIQARAVERLLSLPHFRRILDGSVFDYYRGASLDTCDCTKLPYPHLILHYGGKQSVVFETASALEQYVAVQEAVAAMLMACINYAHQAATEDR